MISITSLLNLSPNLKKLNYNPNMNQLSTTLPIILSYVDVSATGVIRCTMTNSKIFLFLPNSKMACFLSTRWSMILKSTMDFRKWPSFKNTRTPLTSFYRYHIASLYHQMSASKVLLPSFQTKGCMERSNREIRPKRSTSRQLLKERKLL